MHIFHDWTTWKPLGRFNMERSCTKCGMIEYGYRKGWTKL